MSSDNNKDSFNELIKIFLIKSYLGWTNERIYNISSDNKDSFNELINIFLIKSYLRWINKA